MGAELHFSGTYIAGQNEEVTVESVRFYRAGEVKRGSYVYDEADDNKALFLDHVPARYFSEIVLQLSKASVRQPPGNRWKQGMNQALKSLRNTLVTVS